MKRSFLALPLLLLLSVSAIRAERPLELRMMEHVEKITVVDSINVPKEDFFRRYRMQPSSGTILSGEGVASQLAGIPFPEIARGEPFTGFTNEFNDYMIWAQEDTTGYLRLMESVRLGDGSWSVPRFTPPVLNSGTDDEEASIEANAAFPFMLDDGQTLYFSADNEHSLGGYDIFIATKDPSDGEFLIPGNIGMPFNSPFDDYMMAIDRQTGVGWWATDRNQLENDITIYVFAYSDERINVDEDDESLANYASLRGWQELLDEEQQALAKRLRSEIADIRPQLSKTPEFYLPMPGGNTYRYFSDFKNQRSASLMKNYLQSVRKLQDMRNRLAGLRRAYHGSSRNARTAEQIKTLEQQVRSSEADIKNLKSEIYRTELRSN